MASTAHEEHGHGHDHGGDHHHHEEHFVSKYIFSQDHKMIGKQFLMTAVFMGVVAMLLSILFRIQLAWPGESSDFLSFFLGEQWAPNGVLKEDMYLGLVTIHGTIMVFFLAREVGHAMRIVRFFSQQGRVTREHDITDEVTEPEPGVRGQMSQVVAEQRGIHHETQVDGDRGEDDQPERREHRHQRQDGELRTARVGEQAETERLDDAEAGFHHRDAGHQAPREYARPERQHLAHAASERVVTGQARSRACVLSAASGTISSARRCVAFRKTLGARPASWASSHRAAQRHQRSPSLRPGKPYSGCGVERSLPRAFENSRNAVVICAHTVCDPTSWTSVSQQPLRYQPVFGESLQVASGSPNTLT